MTEITILSVTRLSSGVCVAGIKKNGEWVRPTRPNANDTWRQLEYDDCKDAKGDWIVRKGNVVRIDLVKPIPQGDHSEDWLIGQSRPELVDELSDNEYENVCQRITEAATDTIEGEQAERSLIHMHPDEVSSFYFGPDNWNRNKYIPRCDFQIGERAYNNVAVTDVEWRGYGRLLMQKQSKYCFVQAQEVFEENNTDNCWLTLGRYQVDSKIYLLVIGVHLFPVVHFDMDFER